RYTHSMLERLSISEAALRLGVSKTQIRRRIAAEQLLYEREEHPSGAVRIWVLLEDVPPVAPPHTHVAPVEIRASSPSEMVALELALGAQEQARALVAVVTELSSSLAESHRREGALMDELVAL